MKKNITPLVSIITPVYNAEKYLPACAKSIMTQTFTNFEWIMVDDGSTDGSGKLCDQYAQKDKRIVVIHQKNAGPSSARNAALKKARGEYVVFCDSDDYYEPDFCKEMLDAIESSGAEMAVCETNVISDNSDDDHRKADEEYLRLKQSGLVAANDSILLHTNILHWNKIYRRQILKDKDILFPSGQKYADDNYFVTCYFMFVKKIYFLNKKLYNYRHNNASLMAKATKYSKTKAYGTDFINAIIYTYEFLKKHNLYAEKRDYFWQVFFWWFGFSLFLNRNIDVYKNNIQPALDFIARNDITVKEVPAGLNRNFNALVNGYFITSKWHKILGNILKISNERYKSKMLFMGLPLYKTTYRQGRRKVYLFAFIPIFIGRQSKLFEWSF